MEKEYFVMLIKSGYDLRHHDFERAPDGTYRFTKQEALSAVKRWEPLMAVAVPIRNIEAKLGDLFPDRKRPEY